MGSVLLGVITGGLLALVADHLNVKWPVLYLIGLSLTSTLLAFLIFSFLFQTYIGNRIRTIYRLISSKKLNLNRLETSIRKDVLGHLEQDTQNWVRTQQEQIKNLEEQVAFKREFLGNLAHELKTPVFSIEGYVITLLEGGLEDETVNRKFLGRVLNGVDRISAILKDLDDISKYEFNRYTLRKTLFDIVATAQKIIEELEKSAHTRNIQLKFEKQYGSIKVNGDEGKLSQVLTNLIVNSIAYGIKGGTTTIRFHDLEDTKLLVEVADDGLGVSEDHLPRLFERFYRVDKSRARNTGGSGLGLAIVKHIVEAHNQSINVRSTEGVGSTFSFTLDKA